MKILVAGAGSVGRSISRELISHGHEVTLVDRAPDAMRISSVPDADWQLADACDVDALAEAGAGTADVVVAATGDDKSNLVISLLSKTEYGVPRTVARVNNPKNEWLFDDAWGVDVSVSTPRIMTALVEEAVSVGSLVSVFTFHQSGALMHELTLPDDSPVIGELVSEVELPPHTVLAAILREYRPITPDADERFERGDELLFLTAREGESTLGEIPVIFTAITDPVGAKLDSSNITGTSDVLPVEGQLELIRALQPEAKTIGIVYTTSEANSVYSVKVYEEKAAEYGFTIASVGVTAQSEVTQAVDTLIAKGVDCFSNLTDNNVVGVLGSILEKTNEAGIPVYGSEIEQMKLGCVAGAGLDYVQLGIQTGKMAAKILTGEATCQDLPYEVIENYSLYVNSNALAQMGITLPDDLAQEAEEVGATA